MLEVTAGTSHHGLTLWIRRCSPLQGLCMMRGPIATSAAQRACAASLRVTPPPKRQPAQWRLFACNANAGCALEATARTSHHGLAPKERGLPLAKCHTMARRPNKIVAARCVRGKLACVATFYRQPAQWRLFARNANAGCALEATARTSHHGLAPKERGLLLAKWHSMAHKTITTSAARCARGKLACVATSRETACAVVLVHMPREGRVRDGGHSWHVAPWSYIEY